MTLPIDIQRHLRDLLQNDAALTAWLNTHFGASLTVLLGNRQFKAIKGKSFPLVSVVFEPTDVQDLHTTENAHLTERYHLDLGIHFAKASELDDTHLQRLGELEDLAGKAVLQDRRLGGLATAIRVVDRVGDGNVNHPFHFFTLVFEVQRTGTY